MYNPEETYKCRICNLQTKYPYRLQSHLEVHKLKDTLTCAACGIVFQNMKSLTIWHSKNSLKGHLDDSEIIKKTEDCKELLKQNRKSHQNKKTHSSQDKLNVVLFRNGPHSGTGLDSQVEEMEKYSDSWHIVDRETTEEKTDRRNTNDPRLDNSLICPILDNVTNSMMETKMANTDNHSLMKLTKEDSESQTVNIENHKMPELEKEDNNNSVKFQCSQCNFKTKYKNFWKLHKHVHMSKDSVTCDKCNIMFSNRKSLVIWHAKNNLQDHVYQSTHHKFYKGRSRMNINFNLFKKGNKSQAMQKSIQLKPLGEEQCGTIEHDIVTDVALDLSVVKEERTETSVEMSENHEHSVDSTGKSKIAGTFKGHHFSGLDKVYFNTDIESLYCDDLVSNVDTVQGKADIPAEMRMSARTKLDNGNIDKNTNDLNDLKEIIDSADDRSTYTVVLDNMLSVRTNNESVNDGSNSGEIGARMNINFNLFKKGNKSQAMQKSIQLKPLGEEQCGTIEHDIVTDVALDLSVVKEERTETSVEMSENHEHSVDSTGKSKIAGTFKGHHFSGLDKVYFNTDIESLYCDDLVSNVDTVQGKADIPAEMRMSARTKLDNGNIDKNTNDLNDLKEIIDSADDRSTYTVVLDNMLSVRTNNESVNDGSNSGEIGANVSDSNDKDTSDNEQRETSSNDKDLNNNEIQGGGCEGNENGKLRDENNNINKESGDDGDDNDDSYNENMGSPKHVELLICLVCQTSFSNKVLLLKHLLKVHNLTNLCRLCYFKDYEIRRFANPVSLRNHRLRCHENEMKPCVCGSLFLDDNTLMNHLKKFKCTQKEHAELHKCICGKRFTSEMELDSHRIFKCRKRKLVYSDNGYNSKVIRNSKKRSNYVSEIAETETEPILDNVTEKPTANVKHKKQRNAMRDLMNTNYSTENVVKGNELNKDLNNNLVDDVPMKHKEDAYKNKKENRKLGCKESKFPINKSMLAHRKQRDNKKTVCKACFARYKPCDYFYHQKVCHQKRLATNSMRASGLRSGKGGIIVCQKGVWCL